VFFFSSVEANIKPQNAEILTEHEMTSVNQKRAIIIGAGPAGLTAAYELLSRTQIKPIVLEKSEYMGGISRTVNFKGNRIDIGGHRFFSKSDRVMSWWLQMIPLQALENERFAIRYQNMERKVSASTDGPEPTADRVMLVRNRKSRIYYLRHFFDYPITLSKATLINLGLWRTLKIVGSYLKSAAFPEKEENTLEQFFVNRFGNELYKTFFKSYTEKVWGVPCTQISAEWGAQRIKGLSILQTLRHALTRVVRRGSENDLGQKRTETSLIEHFLYPKFGPGQMWEETARRVKEMGGEIYTGYKADRLCTDGPRVTAVEVVNLNKGQREKFTGDYFFSTAPIKDLMRSFDVAPPQNVIEVSDGLVYRDFITVGLLLRGLKIHDETPQGKRLIADNWIYIQEPEVRLGRLQVFNNWSPFLVKDPSTVWLGLEYFCNETDEIWKMTDDDLVAMATAELSLIGIVDAQAVLDATVIRMEKTYPAYFGTYARFDELRTYVDAYENLFLVGRNGMHRYNNQDHSMLTAMMAVDLIIAGETDKTSLWTVNVEMDYHEEK
jgi:protoporphyrinogen oxidase